MRWLLGIAAAVLLIAAPLMWKTTAAGPAADRTEPGASAPVSRNTSPGSGTATPAEPTAPAAAGEPDDWPTYLGPLHNSVSSARDLALDWGAGLRVRWSAAIGEGYSSPVVCGGRVVVMHRQGNEEFVECLAAESGEALWRFAYATGYECPFPYSSGPYSTPTIDQECVYALSAEGDLRCLALDDGRLVWERRIMADYAADRGPFPAGTTPLIEGDVLILNVGGQTTAAGIAGLDKRTGETVWTATSDGCGYATPIPATIAGRRFVFVMTRDNLVCLTPQTGQVHWSIPFHANNRDLGKFNASSPVVWNDRVFVSAMYVGALCVQVLPDGSYREIWRGNQRTLDSQFGNLAVVNGLLCGFSSRDRTFRGLDVETGEVRFMLDGEFGRAAPFVVVQGRFLMLCESGHLSTVQTDSDDARVLSKTATPLLRSPCFSCPALSRGRLYLRDGKQLICLDLRAP